MRLLWQDGDEREWKLSKAEDKAILDAFRTRILGVLDTHPHFNFYQCLSTVKKLLDEAWNRRDFKDMADTLEMLYWSEDKEDKVA